MRRYTPSERKCIHCRTSSDLPAFPRHRHWRGFPDYCQHDCLLNIAALLTWSRYFMKNPKHPIVRIDQSNFRSSTRSSWLLRCVSVSHIKDRNDLEGDFEALDTGSAIVAFQSYCVSRQRCRCSGDFHGGHGVYQHINSVNIVLLLRCAIGETLLQRRCSHALIALDRHY